MYFRRRSPQQSSFQVYKGKSPIISPNSKMKSTIFAYPISNEIRQSQRTYRFGITSPFTGSRRTTLTSDAARPATPCATVCYLAVCASGYVFAKGRLATTPCVTRSMLVERLTGVIRRHGYRSSMNQQMKGRHAHRPVRIAKADRNQCACR